MIVKEQSAFTEWRSWPAPKRGEVVRQVGEELRKNKERKFDQTVDLIVNLQKFDVKKTPLNIFISVPHKIKERKIGAFLEARSNNVDTILKEDFRNLFIQMVQKYPFNHYGVVRPRDVEDYGLTESGKSELLAEILESNMDINRLIK